MRTAMEGYKKRILVSSISDMRTDARILKVMRTLQGAGYEAIHAGRHFDTDTDAGFFFKYKHFKMWFKGGFFMYAEFNIRLFWLLLFTKTDLLLANDLDCLPANFLAANLKRKKLVYDSHELFPEVPELVRRPRVQNIWRAVEAFIFPKLKYCYTVCESIAVYYEKKYGLKPFVVRNIPYCEQKAGSGEINKISDKKIVLYQGAINEGRGLEEMISAVPYLREDAVLVILGNGVLMPKLKKMVESKGVGERVLFPGKVAYEKLSAYTAQAALGLSAEQNIGLNYYYALPNKLFDYIRAGVPVLVSDFPEMRAIVEQYRIGETIDSFEAKDFAEQINEMTEKSESGIFNKALSQANKELCWENEAGILLRLIGSALKFRGR